MVPSVAAVSSWCDRSGLTFAGAFVVRRSVRSVSGWVVVLSFRSVAAAGVCAAAWAVQLPADCEGCAVRRTVAGGALCWSVSVPVVV